MTGTSHEPGSSRRDNNDTRSLTGLHQTRFPQPDPAGPGGGRRPAAGHSLPGEGLAGGSQEEKPSLAFLTPGEYATLDAFGPEERAEVLTAIPLFSSPDELANLDQFPI